MSRRFVTRGIVGLFLGIVVRDIETWQGCLDAGAARLRATHSVMGALRLFALDSAPEFSRCGSSPVLIHILKHIALRNSRAEALAEPLCGTLKRLAMHATSRDALVSLGVVPCLVSVLPVLAEAGEDHAVALARGALRLLQRSATVTALLAPEA
jgi:hypothetical protein